MTEAVATPTTAPARAESLAAFWDLDARLVEVRNVVLLLAALAASENAIEPEGLYPVHDALKGTHDAARKAYEAAFELANGARAAERGR